MSCEVILHRGPGFQVGEVRCEFDDPEIAVLGPIGGWCISFPRLPLELRSHGRSGFIADGATALVLAPGAILGRRALTRLGSRCQWLGLSESLVADCRVERGRSGGSPFGRESSYQLHKSPALALVERQLFRRAASESADDTDLAELACDALAAMIPTRASSVDAPVDIGLADAARAMLAVESSGAPRTTVLAARLGVSVFHLCRTFKRATGQTLQEHSRRLRLDLALERLAEPDVDLSALALDLGFSSHSHFSAAFRKAYGISPSVYRERRRRRCRGRAIA